MKAEKPRNHSSKGQPQRVSKPAVQALSGASNRAISCPRLRKCVFSA